MVYLSSTLFLSALLVNPAWSHMNMVTPPPRRGENNKNYPHGIDYDLASPLGYDKGYPCGGAPRGPPVATYRAGSSISIDVDGSATHDGGHCQFAISYDDCETFVVLKTIMSNCLTETGLHFEIPLPPNAPSSDHAVLSWSWINKTGNREYYMNCADIRVRGVEGGYIEGPELLVANLPGYPTIPEFTRGGYRGEDLFKQRKVIKVTGGGSPIVQIPQIISRGLSHSSPKHNQVDSKSYDNYYDNEYNKNYGNGYGKGHHESHHNGKHHGPKHGNEYDQPYNKHYDNNYNDHHDKAYDNGHYNSYEDDCSDNGHFDYSNETYGVEYDDSYNGSYEDDYESHGNGYTEKDHFDYSNETYGEEYDDNYNGAYEDNYESYDDGYTEKDHFDYSNETYGEEYDDSYNGTYEEYVDISSPQKYGQDQSYETESYTVAPAPAAHNEYIPPSGTYIAGVDTYVNPVKNQKNHHYPGSDCDELQHKIGPQSYHATAPHQISNPHPQTPSYAADQGYNLSQSPQAPEPIEHVKETEPLLVNSSPNNYY